MRSSIKIRRAFTLLEVLAATAITAVLLGSLYSVFHGVLQLRESTFNTLESSLPRAYVRSLLLRDLKGMAAPVGILAGAVIGEKDESEGFRRDRLEFFTSSGIINEQDSWGDLQKIEYYLEEPSEKEEDQEGLDLVRAVTRNLLASVVEEPDEQRLLSGIRSLEITYYDGESWLDSWDSTVVENEAPGAVRIHLDFISTETNQWISTPLELVCEIPAKPIQIEEVNRGNNP